MDLVPHGEGMVLRLKGLERLQQQWLNLRLTDQPNHRVSVSAYAVPLDPLRLFSVSFAVKYRVKPASSQYNHLLNHCLTICETYLPEQLGATWQDLAMRYRTIRGH